MNEQDAFEAWAESKGFNLYRHPGHWLYLNPVTDAARQGWKAGLALATPSPAPSDTPERDSTGRLPGEPFDPAKPIAIARELDTLERREAIARAACIASGDDPDREGPFSEWFDASSYAAVADAILALSLPAREVSGERAAEIAIKAMGWTDPNMLSAAQEAAAGKRWQSYGHGGECCLTSPQVTAFLNVLRGVTATLATTPRSP